MSIDDKANKYTVAAKYLVEEVDPAGFVSWDDSYSVGIESIDDDHKHLLRLINDLQSAVSFDTGQGFERAALAKLIGYTRSHFFKEERLMAKYEYPGFEAHKRLHDEMAAQVRAMIKRHEEGEQGVILELAEFLRDWMIDHILGIDRQYRDFLTGRGVK